MGIRDYLQPGTLSFIEWPDRGAGHLPIPDLELELRYSTPGREALLTGQTERGQMILNVLDLKLSSRLP